MPKKTKKDDPEQSERFIDTAKKVYVDESKARFERAFDAAVSHKKSNQKPTNS